MGAAAYQGRLGRNRRAYGRGVLPGRYVEVEQDDTGSGWRLWLTEQDPRDGPSAGWDLWAETEQDLAEWLGEDGLDVAWLTEPLPDPVLAGLLDHPEHGWRFRYVSPAGAAAWLRGAEVGLGEVGLDGTVAVVSGLVPSVWQPPAEATLVSGQWVVGRLWSWWRRRPRRARLAKFPFVLTVDPATAVDREDPERSGRIVIDTVHHDEDAERLGITSAVPGIIRISTSAPTIRLAIARRPELVRSRWRRWRPIPASADRV